MFTVIRQGTAKPGQVQEVARRVEEGFLPMLRQVPGFVAYHFVDLGQDRIMTVSIYQTQTGADESNSLLGKWAPDNIGSLLVSPPQPTGPAEILIYAA